MLAFGNIRQQLQVGPEVGGPGALQETHRPAAQAPQHKPMRAYAGSRVGNTPGQRFAGTGGSRFSPPEGGGVALVFAVAPAKILAFAERTFSHTRHMQLPV